MSNIFIIVQFDFLAFLLFIKQMNIEESFKQGKYLMLKLKLNNQFDPNQWALITTLDSSIFIKNQQHIINKLMNSPKLYAKYFRLFFTNHLNIMHWYILAVHNKRQIEPYVFKQLLGKKFAFYEQKNQSSKSPKKSQNQSQRDSQNISFMRPSSNQIKQMQEGVMNKFFNDLIELNYKQNKRKPLNLKLFQKQKQGTPIDSHQLYIRTFDACNGRKYVSYDYEKHMKGMSQRYKYNSFLRGIQHDNMLTKRQSSCLNLGTFGEFMQFKDSAKKEKCLLLPMSEILNETKINSIQGFRKVIGENKSSKMVFVNHLGKPITYYIRQVDKKTSKIHQTLR